ncbi:cytochrome P450 [Cylindrobasidium torrendii FP15055 ss-10]|uniref:Cytochrome P450 n=1 Tax=Cylindrobasidium torrendii FP15055 ss-10 TaxID=1314674 RepID=A0A0D7B8G2_9AGAR|nr:cytochrome P450 [Cylindrobasidium torrendii FP15055 ss-10]
MLTYLIFITFLSPICLLVYRLYLYPRFLSPLRHLPGPPLGPIIAGQFGYMLSNEAGIPQRQWVKEYGPVVRVVGPIGVERMILASREALHKILVSDWGSYPRPRFMQYVLGSVAGYGLLTVEGRDHRQMKRAMNPAFGLQHLVPQVEMYYEPIEALIEILNGHIDALVVPQNGKILPMYEWVSRAALDIICSTAFGYRTDSLHNPHNELAEAYEELLNLQSGENLAGFIALFSIPGMGRLSRSGWLQRNSWIFDLHKSLNPGHTMINCMNRIKRVSADLLAEKVADASLVSDNDSKKDIMSILVRARKAGMEKKPGSAADDYVMTDQEMMDQVLTFLGAGHETTASGLAWTLFLLASNPEAQDKLRQEVKTAFDAADGRPDYKQLKEMEYLEHVIMESLRLLPPVPMTIRRADKSDYIDGAYIPAGTLFYIPIRVVNTWTEIWGADAEEFRPERWAHLPPRAHFLTFIEGPHACIGKTMAIVEMKAIVGALINNFAFEPSVEGQVLIPTAAVTMKPKDSMPLRVKRVQK